jgi:hypothetical protein
MTDAELRDEIETEAAKVIDWLRPAGRSLPTEYPLLTPAFVTDVQVIAEQYDAYQGKADNEVWKLSRRVIAEWESEYKGEISKEDFYAAASYAINAAMGRKRLSASGETLRRWCDIVGSYAEMPEIDTFADFLPFEVFRVARHCSKSPKAQGMTHWEIVSIAYEEQLSADELERRYGDDRGSVSEYDKVIGFMSSLQSFSFEWMNEYKAEAVSLINRLNELVVKATGVRA